MKNGKKEYYSSVLYGTKQILLEQIHALEASLNTGLSDEDEKDVRACISLLKAVTAYLDPAQSDTEKSVLLLRNVINVLYRDLWRETTDTPQPQHGVYDDGFLKINLEMRTVERAGERVSLTLTEYRLLEYLVSHNGCILSHQQILDAVWGPGYGEWGYVKLYIMYLRRKLEEDPRNPKYIITEHGLGYRFEI